MNSLPITCKDAKTTFLLARRAERLARPLVDRIDGGMLSIESTFKAGHYYRPELGWHISINVHRVNADGRGLGKMAMHSSVIVNTAELDRAIEKLRLEAESDERARQVSELGGDDADA